MLYPILLQLHHVGDTVSVRLRRKRANYALESLEIPLRPLRQLVPPPAYDRAPSYFIYCGFLFQPLSKDLIYTWSSWRKNAPKEFVYHYEFGVPYCCRADS